MVLLTAIFVFRAWDPSVSGHPRRPGSPRRSSKRVNYPPVTRDASQSLVSATRRLGLPEGDLGKKGNVSMRSKENLCTRPKDENEGKGSKWLTSEVPVNSKRLSPAHRPSARVVSSVQTRMPLRSRRYCFSRPSYLFVRVNYKTDHEFETRTTAGWQDGE